MRRFAAPAVVLAVLAALLAGGASAADPPSARFSLRIDTTIGGEPMSVVGTGVIDGAHGLTAMDFTKTYYGRFQAIVVSSPQLTVFLKGEDPSLFAYRTWTRRDGAANAPFFDPSLPLRLVTQHSATVGAKTVDGTALTGHTVVLSAADARLLAPKASSSMLQHGFSGTVWLTDAGELREFYATVPYGSGRATINEHFLPATSPIHIALPAAATVYDTKADAAMTAVHWAVAMVEVYDAENGTRGYSGMTTSVLKRRYGKDIPAGLEVVSSSKSSYCIQATVKGFTAKKVGPRGLTILGRC
jgi:hypothetical protein